MKPLTDISPDVLRQVRAVLTDIDDTLTSDGRLPAVAYDALEKLHRAGLMVVPVTGRPAGWCDMIARLWPVAGVVGENGAFYFRYLAHERRMQRIYAQDASTRAANRSRLQTIAQGVLKAFPGTAMASDQAYREIDVAIDFAEDVDPLPLATAEAIARHFAAEGATAKVSSIHVNAWFGDHDKLSMAQMFLTHVCGLSDREMMAAVAYCGDSPNDAPMFAHFPVSIGVANVKRFAGFMARLPTYVTKAEGGAGFAEFADHLLSTRM